MEDYKKKYENALEWIKDIYPTLEGAAKEDAEHYFPELKESEERIRKEIIRIVDIWTNSCPTVNGIPAETLLAWLENQGEPVMYDRDNYNSAKEKAWNCKSFDDDSNRKSIFMKGFQDGYQFGIHEEKPHRWTRHDEAVRKEAVECLVDWKNKFPSIYSCDYRNVLNWLKEELSIHAEEKQDEQKPAWSEKHIADVFEKVGLARIVREQGNDQLTNAVQSAMIELSKQKKTAWSEEDERMLDKLIKHFNWGSSHSFDKKDCYEAQDWLKYLKERCTWKPSEEQMEALRIAAEIGSANNSWAMDVLKSMYQDLKKMR